ncbi:MAG TPA: hypothetical protein VKB38_00325 [Terracidiphilus sp.]|nr:hypothetical protein [Terracidiphilus sp.]
MNFGIHISMALLAAVAAVAPAKAGFGQRVNSASGQPAASADAKTDQQVVVRELDDPHSGERWILVPALDHSAGPGRWIVDPAMPAGALGRAGSEKGEAIAKPVIRAGDAIRVEEHTALVDATLEALAMGDAVAGASLRVKLKAGGHVVRAIAVGPGRAKLAPGLASGLASGPASGLASGEDEGR